MKHFLLIAVTAILFSFFSFTDGNDFGLYKGDETWLRLQSFKELGHNEHRPNLAASVHTDKNENWYSAATANLKKNEYGISFSEELNSYQAPNRANNIRFVFHETGFTASPRQIRKKVETPLDLFDSHTKAPCSDEPVEEVGEWKIYFATKGYSRESNPQDVFSSTLSDNRFIAEENKGFIEDDNIRINYLNDENGMRQDFIIKNKPSGAGELKLNLFSESNLTTTICEREILFKNESNHTVMSYSSLKVFDSNGKVLDASFEESKISQPVNGRKLFAIVVNDENAVYPITIDPLSSTPNHSSEGNQSGSGYGFSVSSAGDVNNDGYSDVIIGALFYDNGQTDEGKVFVYHGSPTGLLSIHQWSAESNQSEAYFGRSVSSAGDVNGDGYSDVIIGAGAFDNNQEDEGRVFCYHGSALGLSLTANWNVESNQSGSQFGWSVSKAGDVNSDGFDDVIIGAPLFDKGQSDEGCAFVYMGSIAGLRTNVGWTGQGNQELSFYGFSVSDAGDINGDNFDDILIGANLHDNPLRDEGAAFMYKGSTAGLSQTPAWTSETHTYAWYAFYGVSVSSAGDVNNDGYSDIIVGAYSMDNGETDEGKVFGYYGSSTGFSSTANWTFESNQPYSRLGNTLSDAGDVNNDGYDDIIIGSSEFDNGESNEGKAFVFHGSSTGLALQPNWTAESNQANSYYGISVSDAGDVNNDNLSDVIVGAYLYDNGQTDEGGAFVYHGTSDEPKILNLTMFMQGFYNSGSNSTVRDTIRTYLRSSSAPYAIVDSAKAFLSSTGTAVLAFMNATNGVNYFLQLKHRNSLESWSAYSASFVNSVMNFNFASSGNQTFGANCIQTDFSPIRYGIFSGDINLDATIDAVDLVSVFNSANDFESGYIPTDVSGDNFVDVVDLIVTRNNSRNFVSAVRP